ncbi:MAG: transglutaminase-like domain-containing protein [Candidatus Methanosuratincola sp.]|jgi:transglutaminase-like putative cysteine protease|nr:transglutaminase family protein [Candidatus Methanosuratincola sp.]
MILVPALVALLLVQGAASVYSYDLSITLANGGAAIDCTEQYSPCQMLLNQNVFKNSSEQTAVIESVTLNGADAPWELQTDPDGNPLVRILAAGAIAPMQNATLKIRFRITMDRSQPEVDPALSGTVAEIPQQLKEMYQLTGIWDPSGLEDPGEVFSLAESIRGGEENVLLILRNLILWFEENMVYSYNNTTPQTVWETYKTLSGDCDDQANLFVMFCRIYGIPAYTAIGPIYMPGQVNSDSDHNLHFHTKDVGWHGWAMVYVPNRGGGGAWVPVDLTYFQGGVHKGGHIVSTDWTQHIRGAALYWKDTAVFIEYINFDHISEYARMRDAIIGSDCMWVESHEMSPIGGPGYAESAPLIFMLALIASAAALASSIWLRRRRRTEPLAQPPL